MTPLSRRHLHMPIILAAGTFFCPLNIQAYVVTSSSISSVPPTSLVYSSASDSALLPELIDLVRGVVSFLPEHLNAVHSTSTASLSVLALETLVPKLRRMGAPREYADNLEDVAFRAWNPDQYAVTVAEINRVLGRNNEILASALPALQQCLRDDPQLGWVAGEGFQGCRVTLTARRKTPYSSWCKWQRKSLSSGPCTFQSAVRDTVAMRVVIEPPFDKEGFAVDRWEEEMGHRLCYDVLDVIHRHHKQVPGRVKDYISTPKANGYRSLHTTLLHKHPFEMQIRTGRMHRYAEQGGASHYAYKSPELSQGYLQYISTIKSGGTLAAVAA